MSDQHTPGPWIVGGVFDEWSIESEDHVEIAGICRDSGRGIANARLIAAAPEMLEVCMKLAKYGRAMCKKHMSSKEKEKAEWDLAGAILDAEAAIAKATGNAAEPV